MLLLSSVTTSPTAHGALLVRELGQEPVALERARRDRQPPVIDGQFDCDHFAHPFTATAQALALQLRGKSREARAAYFVEEREKSVESASGMLLLVEVAHYANEPSEYAKTLELAATRHPSDTRLVMRWAQELMLAPETRAEARGVLERLGLEAVPSGLVRHYLHLLGAACLHVGDSAGAAEAWTRALEHPGRCGLESCLVLVEDDAGTGVELEKVSVWAAVVKALPIADEWLERGDAAAALDALEASAADTLADVEVYARFAAAWLQLEPGDPGRRFDKAVALATFVKLADRQPEESPRVRARSMWRAWDSEKLAELAREARDWLDRLRE